MNKNAIKDFAVTSRENLISAVAQKAYQYGITEAAIAPAADSFNGKLLSREEKEQRSRLVERIKAHGYQQVIEEIAYTWFNRFIALRFMEVNEYLDIRPFTDEAGNFAPQLLTEAVHLEMPNVDMEKVYALVEENKRDELYKYLLICQCNELNEPLPGMFQRINDETELLFPDNLLWDDSVLAKMVKNIPADDWKDQVQIIGWLYQYYNSVPKDKVFADLKKNIKITKEKIPAATQLFTPDWIVRYMVENSLGRLWVEHNIAAGQAEANDALLANWRYYLPEAEQEPAVQAELAKIREDYKALEPKDIKVIDPCMGSGHILVYMFDVLMQIYSAYGYTTREAVRSILENNLYGLDIDERAAQLAYFSVMMKAQSYDKRFLRRGDNPAPHVYAIVESNNISRGVLSHFGAGMSELERNNAQTQLSGLLDTMYDAKEYGSILTVEDCDWELLHRYVSSIREEDQLSMEAMNAQETQEKLIPLLNVGQALAQKYMTVVTNPPYMGSSGMGGKLSAFVQKHYPDSKSDLFAVFIERCSKMTIRNGYQAMITQHAWMFLSSFEKLRLKMLICDTVNMAHLGPRAFEEIGGEVVQTTSFVERNSIIPNYIGTYCRLVDPTTQSGKEEMFLSGENRFAACQFNFSKIPGSPVAYWASQNILNAFESEKLSCTAWASKGIITGDNAKFLRLWYEVNIQYINFFATSYENTENSVFKWYPCNKGGEFRKWYGNNEYVINWADNGKEIMQRGQEKKRNCQDYKDEWKFKPSITWSSITSSKSSFRLSQNALSESAGMTLFLKPDSLNQCLAFLNSNVSAFLLQIINPTLNFTAGSIASLPYNPQQVLKYIDSDLVERIISGEKADWDSFETSWDFKCHPLVALRFAGAYAWEDNPMTMSLQSAFEAWEHGCDYRFNQLKANEEELNRIFIDIYGLQDELTPDVEDKDVTVRKADLGRDIRSFISYAVGCMVGRYSIDCEGLAYAGGDWDDSKYKTFLPDKDGILPISDEEYFEDDIVNRFVEFVKVVYGAETLEENLMFVANALGGKGKDARTVIRSYFLNDFFKDHCKIYQKRPIYWLFDSGKKNGFKALIYMHRYQTDTIARIRTDFVHEQQERYRTKMGHLERRLTDTAGSERARLTKELQKLREQADELLKYEEKIHHFADSKIAIDLDDGVKHNYAIFQDVLAAI